jgi:hypothetical protein
MRVYACSGTIIRADAPVALVIPSALAQTKWRGGEEAPRARAATNATPRAMLDAAIGAFGSVIVHLLEARTRQTQKGALHHALVRRVMVLPHYAG